MGATVVDGLILAVPDVVLRIAVPNVGSTILTTLISAAYLTIMLGQRGQTVGNMAVGTRVVDARTGGPVTYARALGRWATELVLGLLFFVGWIVDVLWPLWDRQNQTLHDKAAGTVVLRV